MYAFASLYIGRSVLRVFLQIVELLFYICKTMVLAEFPRGEIIGGFLYINQTGKNM